MKFKAVKTVYCLFHPVEKEEFDLPSSQQIAKYDSEELAREWNSKYGNTQCQSIIGRAYRMIKRTKTVWWMILFYLIAYYAFNVVLVQNSKLVKNCNRRDANYSVVSSTIQEFANNVKNNSSNLCQTKGNVKRQLSQMIDNRTDLNAFVKAEFLKLTYSEDNFIKLLAYLAGFYLKFTIMRWWQQVTMVPRIDTICLALEGSVWCNPKKSEDMVFVKEGISVTMFKQTILRYCLLSWAMCVSMISPSLRQNLRTPEAFSQRRLMNYEEFRKLKIQHDITIDGWRMNWKLPLMWVNSMLNDLDTISSKNDDVKLKALKENLKSTTAFLRCLDKLVNSNANKLPSFLNGFLKLGLLVWLLLGIVSAQTNINCQMFSLPITLVFNFPLMHISELILMFIWLQTASFLVDPFCFDK